MSINSKMTAIANAVRAKTGKTGVLTLDAMATEISSIDTSLFPPLIPRGCIYIARGQLTTTAANKSVIINPAYRSAWALGGLNACAYGIASALNHDGSFNGYQSVSLAENVAGGGTCVRLLRSTPSAGPATGSATISYSIGMLYQIGTFEMEIMVVNFSVYNQNPEAYPQIVSLSDLCSIV